jgi:hypothetical protein
VQADQKAPVYGTGEVEVAADPETVWSVLADIQGWPSWNPDISAVTVRGPVQFPPSGLLEQAPGGRGEQCERHQREDLGHGPCGTGCRHSRACERGRQPQEGGSEKEQGRPAHIANREHDEITS